MLDWLWRWRKRSTPTVRHETLADLRCDSTVLIFADPYMMYDALRIEDISPGTYSIHASIICYPEGGERIRKITIPFGDYKGKDDVRILGEIAVDSGNMVLGDEQTIQEHWKDEGPARIGRTGTPDNHRRVAKLIGDRFGLRWREVDFLHSEFREPISEELEEQIEAFLETFPEFADFTYIYFRVETQNSNHRISEAMKDRLWNRVSLDDSGDPHLLAVSAGFGDGNYTVEGLYNCDGLRAIRIVFIGPDQDEVLEAFPVLRS